MKRRTANEFKGRVQMTVDHDAPSCNDPECAVHGEDVVHRQREAELAREIAVREEQLAASKQEIERLERENEALRRIATLPMNVDRGTILENLPREIELEVDVIKRLDADAK